MSSESLDIAEVVPEAEISTSDRFAIVPERVLFHHDLSDGAVRCYGVLARVANDKGILWRGQVSVAEMMGKSERAVRGYFVELRKAGELVVAKRRMNQTTMWRLRSFTALVRQETAGPNRQETAAPRTGRKLPPNDNQENQKLLTAADATGQPETPLKAREKTPRDLLWDALIEVLGWDPEKLTKGARGRLGKIITSLSEAGARPGDIKARAERYRERWPNVDLTPEALEKHWAMFAPPKAKPESAENRDPGFADPSRFE